MSDTTHAHTNIYIYIYICVCVCVCVLGIQRGYKCKLNLFLVCLSSLKKKVLFPFVS